MCQDDATGRVDGGKIKGMIRSNTSSLSRLLKVINFLKISYFSAFCYLQKKARIVQFVIPVPNLSMLLNM